MRRSIDSGHISLPRTSTETPTAPTNPPAQRPAASLEGPSELASRHPSARHAHGGSHRIRQPPPETSSPQHDSGRLLRTGERSERFSSAGVGGQHSGRMLAAGSTQASSYFSFEASDSPPAHGSQDVQADQPRLEQPAAQRSWLAVATALLATLKRAAGRAMDEAAVTLSIVTLPKIPPRLMGALAGHSIHQSIAVGLPTFVREMVGVGVMQALRAQPQEVAVGLQLSVGAVNFAAQVGREWREQRNPDVAARAYFSLSEQDWAAKSPQEQATMRMHHRKVSRAITALQVSSSVTNLALMMQGFAARDQASALRPLANEVKVGVYAAMRDGLQASFSMVGFKPSPTAETGREFAAGMAGAAHAASAATYAAANSASAFLGDALMGAWVPERGNAMAKLMGSSEATMSHAEAWKEVALGAGVSAMANTLAETIDWFQRMEHFVNQTGATQHFEPRLTGTDYGRLLDQAPARAAAFNGIFSALTLAGGEMGKSDLPPAVQQFIGNVGLGVMISMLDSPISGLWQAEEAVRGEPAPPSGVTLTELEEGQPSRPASGPSSGEISGSDSSGTSYVSAGNPPERGRGAGNGAS